jgi:choline kinase
MTEIFTTKLLVPAAGFGKRVGGPKAKELLILKEEAKPLIEWTLALAKRSKMSAVIISRHDKVDLNEYLLTASKRYPIEVCLITKSEEWPDSILQSEAHWTDRNIVVLPDTRFEPKDMAHQIHSVLEKKNYVFATFIPEVLHTWGVVRLTDTESSIAEKPKVWTESDQAWGLFGFQKAHGKKLLQAMLASKGEFRSFTNQPVDCLPLTAFKDVGRQGMDLFKA